MEHVTITSGERKHTEKTLGKDKEPTKEKEHKKTIEKKKPKRSANEDDDGGQEHKDFMQTGVPQDSSDPDLKDLTDQKCWRIFVLKQRLRSVENTHVLYRVRFLSYFC